MRKVLQSRIFFMVHNSCKVLRADGRLVNMSGVFTIVCLLVLRWKRGRELVHCLYKKTPDITVVFF